MAAIMGERAVLFLQSPAELRSLPADTNKARISAWQSSAFFGSRMDQKSKAVDSGRQLNVKPTSSQRNVTCMAAEQGVDVNEQAGKQPIRKVQAGARCHPVGRRQLITLGASTAAAACQVCSLLAPSKASAADWGYGQLSGPPQWASACAVGKEQSPIDLPKSLSALETKSKWGSLEFQYVPASPSFYNTGHGTMQVDFPRGGNRLVIGERTLDLVQYHFHAPSEHSFEGQRAAMEAHLVHSDSKGNLAVVGVVLQADPRAPRNLCLQAALEFAPNQKLDRLPAPVSCFFRPDPDAQFCPSLAISPAYLLPKANADGKYEYMNYDGSLTTPPCSEGVDWFVLATPIKLPGQQVIEFMSYVGEKRTFSMNSRPIQPLNNRVISMGP